MGAGHAHTLTVHEHSFVHDLHAECKVVAATASVVTIAMMPRDQWWAYATVALGFVALARSAHVPLAFLGRRLVVVAPFLVAAALLPFVASGPHRSIGGVTVSQPGLVAAGGIVGKTVAGYLVAAVLTATTEPAEILRALSRLRVPSAVIAVAAFMLRYADVIGGELRRLQTARVARGDDPRWIWQARAIGSTAGTVFVRSYERGERVYLAMQARGFKGQWLPLHDTAPGGDEWLLALTVPVAVAAITTMAWFL